MSEMGKECQRGQIRSALRCRFEANRHIADTQAIDPLLLREWQDYQKAMNVWKQHNHGTDVLAGSMNVKTSEDVFADVLKQVRVLCLLSGYRLILGVSIG